MADQRPGCPRVARHRRSAAGRSSRTCHPTSRSPLRTSRSAPAFVFHNQAADVIDGNPEHIIDLSSPDPGRALITGRADDIATGTFDHGNAFKISPLRGIRKTAPYFHDNSAKTLEDVLNHYQQFFLIVSDPDGPAPGSAPPLIQLNEQDKKDIIAFMKLLD